jgi:uncharacterized membrane protein
MTRSETGRAVNRRPARYVKADMTEKRSKYDTDPLDPEFARRTEEVMGRTGAVSNDQQTEPLRRSVPAEDATRRFDEQLSDSYPSVFVPPAYQSPPRGFAGFEAGPHHPPATVQPPPPGPSSPYTTPPVRPTARKVARLGIGENIATILPYAPFYIGLVVALVELLIVPREETRTRFHAAQGLALQLAILAGSFIFGVVGSITDSGFGGFLFGLASFVFLIVSMWRVWEGKPHHVAPLDEATRWLNERVAPTK